MIVQVKCITDGQIEGVFLHVTSTFWELLAYFLGLLPCYRVLHRDGPWPEVHWLDTSSSHADHRRDQSSFILDLDFS